MTILSIDQGTSATKALVVDDGGVTLATSVVAVHPQAVDGGVIQDPYELLNSVVEAGRRALDLAGVPVRGVALANQGETVMAWDRRSGAPTGPAISWQDSRATEVCQAFDPIVAERVTRLTGLPLDPYFSAPKMTWLARRSPGHLVVTTTDTWLLHQLCGAFVTDVTTASRSMLLDLDDRAWSAEACAAFDLDPAGLPEVVSCAEVVGTTQAFGPPLEIAGLAVDQQAALVGERCLRAGEAKCTFGTGAFVLMTCGSTPVRSTSGLSASVAWEIRDDVSYCLDGQSYTAGAAISWLVSMGLLAGPEQLDDQAGSVADAGGVVVVPALAGLGAPWWDPSARGSIEGLGLDTEPGHLVRAVVEGLAAQVALVVSSAGDDLGIEPGTLRIDGGLARSRVLGQCQADLLQAPVEVFGSPDATALGVASLARIGLDPTLALPSEALSPLAVYAPRISADEAAVRLERFRAAATRAIEARDGR